MDINSELLIISCVIGNKYNNKFFKAPTKYGYCVLFSNNPEIKENVEKQGWNFFLLPFELSDNYLQNSLDAKYVKFLQFLHDYDDFQSFPHILYFDHKLRVKDEHVKEILDTCDKSILIRKHPRSTNIWDEVNAANGQQRYVQNMKQTLSILREKIAKGEMSEDGVVCHTGLLYYNELEPILPMIQNIYDTCLNLKQPECQIIWCMFCKKYLDSIQIIDTHINTNLSDDNLWFAQPDDSNIEGFENASFSSIIFIMFIIFIIIVIFTHFKRIKHFLKWK